jgi:hypothetical protein
MQSLINAFIFKYKSTYQLLNQTAPKFLSIAHFFFLQALITGNLDDFTVRLLAKLRLPLAVKSRLL